MQHTPKAFAQWGSRTARSLAMRHTKSKLTTGSLVALVIATSVNLGMGQVAAPQPISGTDVSILFPVPRSAADLQKLISVGELSGPSAAPQRARLWSETDFASFLGIAENPAVQTAAPGLPLVLPPEVKRIDAWFIAGIRIDPGAPGLSSNIIEQYGQQPQIRFIAQAVTRLDGGQIKIHDIAAHLIFSFSMPPAPPAVSGCLPRSNPDMDSFRVVVRDFVALRDQLAAGKFGGTKVKTAGVALGVHPGLTGPSAKPFRDVLKAVLEKNLSPQRLPGSSSRCRRFRGRANWLSCRFPVRHSMAGPSRNS
jgi:hypothetical protein